jgi:predicted phosphodiesterase
MKMPKYKVMATEYIFKDAFIEAKDAEEAYEKAQADNVDWTIVGGDWEIHEDMTFEENEDE